MTTRLEVQQNDWWGIEGGYEATICWFYNDRAGQWEDRLDQELQREIRHGNAPVPIGPFQHFPNYKTIGENLLEIVELTPSQVNLLANLTCWSVIESKEQLEPLFAG